MKEDTKIVHWRFLARGTYAELAEKQRQAADYLKDNPNQRLRVVASNPDFQGRTKSDFEIACENRPPVRRGMPDYEIGYGKRNGQWVELYIPTSPGMPSRRKRGRPPGSKNRPNK